MRAFEVRCARVDYCERTFGSGGRPLNFTAMHPGQLDPNDLERAILDRLARDRPTLRPLISQLHVLSREYTGVGSFTRFNCPDSAPDLGDGHLDLDGLIVMPGVPTGLGAILFCEGGMPKCLDTYTFGEDSWDGVYSGFSISETA